MGSLPVIKERTPPARMADTGTRTNDYIEIKVMLYNLHIFQ